LIQVNDGLSLVIDDVLGLQCPELDLALQRAVLGPGPERQSRARPILPRIARAHRGRSAWRFVARRPPG